MKLKIPKIAFKLPRFRAGMIVSFWIIVIGSLMSFVNDRQSKKICQRIDVSIDNELGNYFIEDVDVKNLMTYNFSENIENQSHSFISLKELESRVKKHGFVENVIVSKDYKGNLYVQVHQYKPMARLTARTGSDKYISTSGKILPVSDRFTARVLIIEGPFNAKLTQSDWNNDSLRTPYYQFVKKINKDEFMQSMVASVFINSKGEITILPQIGKQKIEFGTPENQELKFAKLNAFYQKIIPVKGWNRYSTVNLKYQNQIICE
ncbi:MAG: cell division protein FtsQ [Bacteroidota bacterium]|nr:cell division protein FtsQ [Bacteroidota bacterium]